MTVVSSNWITVVFEALRRYQACLNTVCADVTFGKEIKDVFYHQHSDIIHFAINVQLNNDTKQLH